MGNSVWKYNSDKIILNEKIKDLPLQRLSVSIKQRKFLYVKNKEEKLKVVKIERKDFREKIGNNEWFIPSIETLRKFFPETYKLVKNSYDHQLGFISTVPINRNYETEIFGRERHSFPFFQKYSNSIDLETINDCIFIYKEIGLNISETFEKEFEEYQKKLEDIFKAYEKMYEQITEMLLKGIMEDITDKTQKEMKEISN
jgi:hypothetical protein